MYVEDAEADIARLFDTAGDGSLVDKEGTHEQLYERLRTRYDRMKIRVGILNTVQVLVDYYY